MSHFNFVVGDESLATELRVRTVIDLTAFFDSYQKEYESSDFDMSCGVTYEETIHDCSINGGYASVWAICGLASVIERPIVSVYPTVNGPQDILTTVLNRTFLPRRNYDTTREPVFVMWTCLTAHDSRTIWHPNHFVALVSPSYIASSMPSAANPSTVVVRSSTIVRPWESPFSDIIQSTSQSSHSDSYLKSSVDGNDVDNSLPYQPLTTHKGGSAQPCLIEAHRGGLRLELEGYLYV